MKLDDTGTIHFTLKSDGEEVTVLYTSEVDPFSTFQNAALWQMAAEAKTIYHDSGFDAACEFLNQFAKEPVSGDLDELLHLGYMDLLNEA
jgi:hypothetical protein